MREEPERVDYLVRQVGTDRWEVSRHGIEKPVASFPDRDDAIEIAEHLTTISGFAAARRRH